MAQLDCRIVLGREALPIEVPAGYAGPLTFPGNGKTVWWTGRVAIGLRHEKPRRDLASQSGEWLQNLLLASRASRPALAV
jgi:hypothetical protein